jgi:lipopolysaccharide/colanic/teichoic acid biosynthesis glycosyltransferase
VAASISAPNQAPLISRWSLSPGKRLMDCAAAIAGLIVASPIMVAVATWILLTSGRPIIFRQWRVGRGAQKFQLFKFRTMTVNASANGLGVTRTGDARITATGRWLRKWKLDELPQILNVIYGDMTLVGPRPDLEEFWALASVSDRAVLALIPGITGAASLAYCDEERILATVPPENVTALYVNEILPRKARLDLDYARRATFRSDCGMLLQTLICPFTMAAWRKRALDE